MSPNTRGTFQTLDRGRFEHIRESVQGRSVVTGSA